MLRSASIVVSKAQAARAGFGACGVLSPTRDVRSSVLLPTRTSGADSLAKEVGTGVPPVKEACAKELPPTMVEELAM